MKAMHAMLTAMNAFIVKYFINSFAPQPQPQPQPQSQPQSQSQPQPLPQSEPVAGPSSQAEPVAGPSSRAEPVAGPSSRAELEPPILERQVELELESAGSESEVDPDAETETEEEEESGSHSPKRAKLVNPSSGEIEAAVLPLSSTSQTQLKREEEEGAFRSEVRRKGMRFQVVTADQSRFLPNPHAPITGTGLLKNLSKMTPAQQMKSQCKHCFKKFSRLAAYLKHLNSSSCKNMVEGHWCAFCDKVFINEPSKERHELRHKMARARKQAGGSGRTMEQIENLHGCKVFRHVFEEDETDTIEGAFMAKSREMTTLVVEELRREKVVKFGTITLGNFVVPGPNGGNDRESQIPMRSVYNILFLSDEERIPSLMTKCLRETLSRVDDLEETGSGWSLASVADIRLAIGKCTLHGGNPASNSKDLIKQIKGKDQLLDVEVDRDLCFLGALAQHFIQSHTDFETKKWIASVPNLGNLEFPLDFRKVSKFEELNPQLETGINIFLKDGKMVYPVHRSAAENPKNYANLLLFPYTEGGKKLWHYVYIKDLDAFLQCYNTHGGVARRHKSVHCTNCLSNFTSQNALKTHQELCFNNREQMLVMPKAGEKIEFTNHLKRFGHDFIGYADFESVLIPADRKDHPTCKNCQREGDISKCKHATKIQNNQQAICYSLVYVDREKNVVFQRTEIDRDIMPKFFKALKDAEDLLLPQLQVAKHNMIWTKEDEDRYAKSVVCHVCGKPYESQGKLAKVRDHCHRTGKHLGGAHMSCNVNRRAKTNLQVYFHNFSKYDSHFIAQHYDGRTKNTRVKAMAYNSERFRIINLGKTQLMDSLSLLDAPLAELAGDLVRGDHPFKILESSGIYESEEQKQLLIRGKGIYPYEYITSYKRLLESRLPDREHFYSRLQDEVPAEEDYQHALKTFEAFGCRNIADYTRLYCHLDTLLLAEIMSEFMDEAMKDFGLDASNYISLPQLSFDGMFKKFNLSLDVIPDPDMILLFESAIRGGVSYVSTRKVDVEKDGGILQYYDFSNLYGWSQMQKLPARNYRWLSKKEIKQLKIKDLDPEGEKGYALEVDLEYPKNIRRKHRHMPLAPNHDVIFWDDLSDYSKECLNATSGKKNNKRYKSEKLCSNFHPKKKYFTHYRNLQFYLRHGMKLKKIHRVVEFEQEAFSKEYIKFTAHKRKTSKTAFKKRTAKLYANANFGKWIQNVRKYVDVIIASKKSTVAKYIGQPNFIDFRVLNDNLVAIFMRKKRVVMDRKFSVGFTILELAKLKMFECFYDVILPRFGDDNIDLLLTDTDSFILHIKNHTRDEARRKLKDIMDFSTIDKDDPLFCEDRARVPGFLKDEIPQGQIEECIALRSKCYAFRSRDDKTKKVEIEKKCKGVRRPNVRKLKIDAYRDCLADIKAVKTEVTRIEARNHRVRTICQKKIALTSFDDKRHIKNCGVHSLPYPQDSSASFCNRCQK